MCVWKKAFGRPVAIACAALLASAAAQEAQALSKQASDFLLSISIDPASENVKLAAQEGTITTVIGGDSEVNSLESLATAKKKNGARCFVDTRAYIRSLKADFAHTEDATRAGQPLYTCAYQIYLTVEERKLSGKKSLETLERK